jgi:polyphosphate kinase
MIDEEQEQTPVSTGTVRNADQPPRLDDPSLYINREMSWLALNRRILEEAEDCTQPLLERVKFLAICGSNLDEFCMVRVSGLERQLDRGALAAPPDRMTPGEQLDAIRAEVQRLLQAYSRCWQDLVPALHQAGVRIHRIADLSIGDQEALRLYFREMIAPVLTPLAVDVCHPFPFISNVCLNLAVVVRDGAGVHHCARVKLPGAGIHRFVEVPDGRGRTQQQIAPQKDTDLVMLEDLVATNLDLLFPGYTVAASYLFRVTRDAEIQIVMDEAPDLLTAVEESVETRRAGSPVILEVESSMPDSIREMLAQQLDLSPHHIYGWEGPLALVDLWQLAGLSRPDLHDPPFLPVIPSSLAEDKDLLSSLQHQNVLLYHPYDSFAPVIDLLYQAARSPDVIAIKMTLYRIDQNSPVIDALLEARQNGKQVAVLVELKAKFDEKNNIIWARKLEQEGVHVVYGLVGLKVHAKLCMIVKRERDGIVTYCHLSSGNYNAVTTRIYGDLGYFTCDRTIAADMALLFNALTGYADMDHFQKLLVAPRGLRREIVARIERERERHLHHGDGYIAFKLNGLLDGEVIQALYRASQAGVKIDLNVRGLCSLRPGVPGVSETIRVTSIISRFLEHARIYYFKNGDAPEIYMGSADMMPRNLNRRVESLFPVEDPEVKQMIIDLILPVHLKDNVKARELQPDGRYRRVVPAPGEELVDSQEWLIAHRGSWHHVI